MVKLLRTDTTLDLSQKARVVRTLNHPCEHYIPPATRARTMFTPLVRPNKRSTLMGQAGGRNVHQRTNETAPHTTLQPTHHLPNLGCSTSSRAADQYVNGSDAANRRMICVCDANRRMNVKTNA